MIPFLILEFKKVKKEWHENVCLITVIELNGNICTYN